MKESAHANAKEPVLLDGPHLYKWRKAKVVLTSRDPTYEQKLTRIRTILSNLQPDEAFFDR